MKTSFCKTVTVALIKVWAYFSSVYSGFWLALEITVRLFWFCTCWVLRRVQNTRAKCFNQAEKTCCFLPNQKKKNILTCLGLAFPRFPPIASFCFVFWLASCVCFNWRDAITLGLVWRCVWNIFVYFVFNFCCSFCFTQTTCRFN